MSPLRKAQSREQAFRSACIGKRPLSCMILRGVLQAVILPNVWGVCFYGHRRWTVCCPGLLILQDAAARLAVHTGRTGHWARIQGVGGDGGIRGHSAGRAVLQPVDVFCERSRCLHPTMTPLEMHPLVTSQAQSSHAAPCDRAITH